MASVAIASACSPIDREKPVVTITASPPKIVIPPDAEIPCQTAPKPPVDPVTNKAPEDEVFNMSAADRTEIHACDRRRAAAVAAIKASNGAAP